jgi:hypothetical protein
MNRLIPKPCARTTRSAKLDTLTWANLEEIGYDG